MTLDMPGDGTCRSPRLNPTQLAFIPCLPTDLRYSFTLPADLQTPGVARHATRAILNVHSLTPMADAAVQTVSELTTCACRFTPGNEIYLSLRYRHDALYITLFDDHPQHTNRHLKSACEDHRCTSLDLLDRVIGACDGNWGIGPSSTFNGGTKMWALLPREGAEGYVKR
ncbi:ATP-binding protein [Streptomyces sp. NPDC004539]|uniref:ATP-binding protein n=1 Tax=Streptomyces sp. NPDC004539 TaxID=3154280 RepID=UPI0033AB4593